MGKGQVEGGKALQAARAAELDAASHRPLDLRDRPETGRPPGPSASAVRPRVAAVSRPDREACCRTLELWNRNLDVESRGRLSAPSLESGSLESAYGGHPGIRVLGFWIVDLRIVPSPPPDRGAPKDLRSF